VTLTARWLPMTEIRRGLTEIQLSHNTVGSMTAINVKTHGATGDGMSDDYAAVMAAIQEAVDGGGRTVFFPAGDYASSGSIGNGTEGFTQLCLLGDGERATRLKVTENVAPISGYWVECRSVNLKINANFLGSPAFDVDLDKSYISSTAGSTAGPTMACASTPTSKACSTGLTTTSSHNAPATAFTPPTASTTPGSSTTTSDPAGRTCRSNLDGAHHRQPP
jgi:hypothetical protein